MAAIEGAALKPALRLASACLTWLTWTVATTMGVGAIVVVGNLHRLSPISPVGEPLRSILQLIFVLLWGLLGGLPQWLVLRRYYSRAWVWLCFSGVASFAALLGAAMISMLFYRYWHVGGHEWGGLVGSFAGAGAIMGLIQRRAWREMGSRSLGRGWLWTAVTIVGVTQLLVTVPLGDILMQQGVFGRTQQVPDGQLPVLLGFVVFGACTGLVVARDIGRMHATRSGEQN